MLNYKLDNQPVNYSCVFLTTILCFLFQTCDINVNSQVTMRRHFSIANDPRLSEISSISE